MLCSFTLVFLAPSPLKGREGKTYRGAHETYLSSPTSGEAGGCRRHAGHVVVVCMFCMDSGELAQPPKIGVTVPRKERRQTKTQLTNKGGMVETRKQDTGRPEEDTIT
ncbi:hypothetical protein B0H63DRAFT_466613 [Podospora didyma]|uniref:Uncharacterized protein n=1 Tax=Podospora didyma TaxID=330526 RepID=A0AAE0P076_9PEZI|nr:hypothetical protein B0H63DRAFT_466613 [Podospora didyma]